MASPVPRKLLDSRIIHADPRLHIRSDRYLTEGGDVIGPSHVIDAPDQVTVVALTAAGGLVLVRRYQHGVGKIVIGLPDGQVECRSATPQLDEAEALATPDHVSQMLQAGTANIRPFPPRHRSDGPCPRSLEAAARTTLLDSTGYAGGAWSLLSRSHPDPAHQTNVAFCFLAAGVSPPQAALPDHRRDVFHMDLVQVLRHLRQGISIHQSAHIGALWSAAASLAARQSGETGDLPGRLRRFFAGEDDGLRPDGQTLFPGAAVGG